MIVLINPSSALDYKAVDCRGFQKLAVISQLWHLFSIVLGLQRSISSILGALIGNKTGVAKITANFI